MNARWAASYVVVMVDTSRLCLIKKLVYSRRRSTHWLHRNAKSATMNANGTIVVVHAGPPRMYVGAFPNVAFGLLR